MSTRVVIEFSLVKESSNMNNSEIIKDIEEIFSNEEVSIPWINNVEKISLK
jgi:hypothetical protein